MNTANGNVLTMHVRDVAGLNGTTFVPTVDGKTFANPVAVIGIDAQRRVWIHCGTDLCRSPGL